MPFPQWKICVHKYENRHKTGPTGIYKQVFMGARTLMAGTLSDYTLHSPGKRVFRGLYFKARAIQMLGHGMSLGRLDSQ